MDGVPDTTRQETIESAKRQRSAVDEAATQKQKKEAHETKLKAREVAARAAAADGRHCRGDSQGLYEVDR